jgi:NAD(P)H-dependent flavin oxidoreductase YrpB (nitropropane dioxygenase family)
VDTTVDAFLPKPNPLIIQGGMGAGVSNWMLARAVALKGQLGVVSGTVIDTIIVRRLQDGDGGGHVRRAMAKFPMPDVSAEVLRRYFRPEGRKPGEPYRLLPMYRQSTNALRQRITMLAAFVEVYRRKDTMAPSA